LLHALPIEAAERFLPEPVSEIIARCKEGDLDAFRELVEGNQGFAFALAFRLLCNEEDAKDVVQESFVRVWRHLIRYDSGQKFTTWLYRIVVNLCYDRLKARKRRTRIMVSADDESSPGIVSSSPLLDKELANREIAAIIERLADRLSSKQRMVFVLRDLQDLDMKEIVEVTGMPMGSVKTNLYLARRTIRERLVQFDQSLTGSHEL